MVTLEVALPDRIESDIDRLIEQGDFLNREQAIEELLSLGLSAQETGDESEEELDEDLFTQAVDEQQDPANQYNDPL
ncbi:ribbon-helix-helix domain-containing protein [Haladaptatus pallidirubidus]|uniref:CopG family transcriptional regulator n=1 Tax=Haladaptatus pallidirubidus TaxID=1008152 RepID=A0AAV3UIU8_9EURY|nr:ribbon-helix-helix domain-containing protein [Haladaptatus pallidirubidus]